MFRAALYIMYVYTTLPVHNNVWVLKVRANNEYIIIFIIFFWT